MSSFGFAVPKAKAKQSIPNAKRQESLRRQDLVPAAVQRHRLSAAQIRAKQNRTFTKAEIATHNTKKDCWVIIHGKGMYIYIYIYT
jgi:cytochrome b involved in lipid metabolism